MGKVKLIFLFLCFAINLFPQNLSLREFEDIYFELNNKRIKGELNYFNHYKPFTNKIVLGNLIRSGGEETDYYRRFFYYEGMKNAGGVIADSLYVLSKATGGKFNLFEYVSEDFYLNVNPIVNAELSYQYDSKVLFWNSGVSLYGYYKNNLGFFLNFKDNHYNYLDDKNNVDKRRDFSRESGFVHITNFDKGFDFSDVESGVYYEWESGSLGFAKEHLYIGSGRGGNLILSDKVPSFPFISFSFSPIEWLKFDYIHGFLNSEIADSTIIRYNPSTRLTLTSIPKFLALHMLSFKPMSNMNIMLGESMVYTEKLKPIYFIPLLFFRLADHYIMGKEMKDVGDNAQLFADISYIVPKIKAEFYSTLFIDEMSIRDISEGGNLSAIGYTLGMEVVDPIFVNSSIVFEYTKTNPFVYRNGEIAKEYYSSGYVLGHWMGSNADQIYLSYFQKITREFYGKLTAEYVRKGGIEEPLDQYRLPYPTFLYGPRLTYKSISMDLRYRIFYDLTARLAYSYTDMSDEDVLRTPEFMIGAGHSFSVGLYYGF